MPVDRIKLFEQIQTVQLGLIAACDEVDAVETCNNQRGDSLANYGAELDARKLALDQSEIDFQKKSAALSQIQKTAADRLGVIKTLEGNQHELKLQADLIRGQLKSALTEKEKVESVCAGLLRDKNDLRLSLKMRGEPARNPLAQYTRKFKCPACGVDACFGSSQLEDGKRRYYCSGQNERGCSAKFSSHEDDIWQHFVSVVITPFISREEYEGTFNPAPKREILGPEIVPPEVNAPNAVRAVLGYLPK